MTSTLPSVVAVLLVSSDSATASPVSILAARTYPSSGSPTGSCTLVLNVLDASGARPPTDRPVRASTSVSWESSTASAGRATTSTSIDCPEAMGTLPPLVTTIGRAMLLPSPEMTASGRLAALPIAPVRSTNGVVDVIVGVCPSASPVTSLFSESGSTRSPTGTIRPRIEYSPAARPSGRSAEMAKLFVPPPGSSLTDWLDKLPIWISVAPALANTCRLIRWPYGKATFPALVTTTGTRPVTRWPATTSAGMTTPSNAPVRSMNPRVTAIGVSATTTLLPSSDSITLSAPSTTATNR